MSFFKNLFGGGAKSDSDANALWLYVQCSKCGAPVAIRVDTRNDISVDYETGGKYLRKEIMDSTCFQLMYADVQFDGTGKIMEQTVQGGKFLTRDEFDTARAEFDAKKEAKRHS
jgi:hypothetical protein